PTLQCGSPVTAHLCYAPIIPTSLLQSGLLMGLSMEHISISQTFRAVFLWGPEPEPDYQPMPLGIAAVKKRTHSRQPKRQRIAMLISGILTAKLWQHLTLLPLALVLLNQQQYRELGLLVLALQILAILAEVALIII